MSVEIVFRPVGWVKSPVTEVAHTEWADVVSEITLDEALVGGLQGIEEYSHLQVIFHLSGVRFDPADDMARRPRDRDDVPVMGVFATRTQYRPNPIAVTVVELLGVDGKVLRVKGLDALDGSPVLDIKPHVPDLERDAEVRVPGWLRALREASASK